jgi:acetyl esterase/lipase
MRSIPFLAFWLSIFVLVSCAKNDVPAVKTMLDVSYGADPAQKMDIYLPANGSTASTKAVIMIHGGGWTAGDKSASTQYVDSLRKRLPDYAVFNINYRLSAAPLNLFPAQEMDVKSAVEFIYNKRSEYNISDKFVLIGESAGGHLAMLYAYKYNSPVKIKAVVSLFGPSDLTDMYNNPVNGNPSISLGVAQAVGATPSVNPSLYASSSPINFISAGTAMPTILLHGGMDILVSPSQSVAVQNKLIAAGITSQYVLYPSKGHGYDWDGATFFDAFNNIQNFLTANVP